MITIRWPREKNLLKKRKFSGDGKNVAELKLIENKINLIRKLKLNEIEKVKDE